MWKISLIFAVLCVSGSLASNLKVSVYYSTLCSDSVRFFGNQFYPAYQNHSGHMEVDLVPYGKANATNVSGTWEFECQFGAAECYGNKAHTCAIELYSVAESTEFVVCAMSSGNATLDANLEECANSSSISWTVLQECMSSGQGDEFLAANGRRTDLLIPDLINFVPTIVINDVFSKHLHTLAFNHFPETLVFLMEQVECGFCQFSGSNEVLSSKTFVLSVALLLLIFQKNFV